jgi:uncharacterized membrane protein
MLNNRVIMVWLSYLLIIAGVLSIITYPYNDNIWRYVVTSIHGNPDAPDNWGLAIEYCVITSLTMITLGISLVIINRICNGCGGSADCGTRDSSPKQP